MSNKSWVSEVVESTKSDQFQSWLSLMSNELDVFFSEDVPGILPPDDRYGPAALDAVSQNILEKYDSWSDLFDDHCRQDLLDRYVRYFGEAWRRPFGGLWLHVPDSDPDLPPWKTGPVVSLPFFPLLHEPLGQLKKSISRRDPFLFSRVHGHMHSFMEKWEQDGRPPQKVEWPNLLDS